MRLKISPNRPGSWKAFLLVGAIILSFSKCAKSPLPSRLIDVLTRDNIIRSPLAEMEKSFESVALKFDKNDAFIYESANVWRNSCEPLDISDDGRCNSLIK